MDLIFMNNQFEDVGVMKDYQFDLAFGADENDFECKISRNRHCCEGGFFLYIENTEYGGIIDEIMTNTYIDEVSYRGRTWHGFLDSKCIIPLQADDSAAAGVNLKLTDVSGASYVGKYLIVSGEANKILGWILQRIGLSDLFEASSEDSGIVINEFQFDRYCMAYDGITKMLKKAGGKLKLNFSSGKVVVKAEALVDYSQDEQFDSDLISMKITNNVAPVNHLIALGRGELDEREVINLYANSSGEISHTQSLTGILEVVDVYDYSSVESVEELEAEAIKRLQEEWNKDSIETDFKSDSNSFDIGDIVGAIDNETKIKGTAEITKKIVSIKNNTTNISYKVGGK